MASVAGELLQPNSPETQCARLPQYGLSPVALLTNDDGPPSDSSPNIFSFAKLLIKTLGWEVRVVIPDCQKSWVGKAYAISDTISGSYFYPLEPDGLKGEITVERRPLKEGETMEWILLTGTPATCTNIALHNIYPGEIDIVLSGPNHGRNSSTAFSLSSGTIGAALAAATSAPVPGPGSSPLKSTLHEKHIPAIAVSYGVVKRPVPASTIDLANECAVEVVEKLWKNWGQDGEDKVQLYTVNVPLVEEALSKERRKVCWTTIWRNQYGRLFSPTVKSGDKPSDGIVDDPDATRTNENQPQGAETSAKSAAGPAALNTPASGSSTPNQPDHTQSGPSELSQPLKFRFAPDIGPLVFPAIESVPEYSDAWALAKEWISVTPIRAAFAPIENPPIGVWN